MIKLKFGKLVANANQMSYVSNNVLGKIFGVSGSKIRSLYMGYFDKIKRKDQPLLAQLQQSARQIPRQRYGYRFLKAYHI